MSFWQDYQIRTKMNDDDDDQIRGKDLFYLMDKDSRRAEQPFRLLRCEGQYRELSGDE